MVNLVVGVAQISLLLRHARSLKDKRHVVQSLTQKLRNHGFTVKECAYADIPRQASLGFATVGTSAEDVQLDLDAAIRMFHNVDAEVLNVSQDVFDFSDPELADFQTAEENDPRG